MEYDFTPSQWVQICKRSEPLIEQYRQKGIAGPIGQAMRDTIAVIRKEGFHDTKLKIHDTKFKIHDTYSRVKIWRQKNKDKLSAQNRRAYLKRKENENEKASL